VLTRRAMLGAATAAVLLAGAASYAEATQIILIGGGVEGSVHAQAARQVCISVEEHAGDEYGCLARSAPGSAFNIRAVEIGLMEFGLAQSGPVREAVSGSGAWEGSPAASLRGVFSLGPERGEMVSSADVAEALVYDLTTAVFETLDALREAHPALRSLEPAAMVQGLSAPLHAGAARYYREQGWLEAQ